MLGDKQNSKEKLPQELEFSAQHPSSLWITGFPGGSDGKECACSQDTGVQSLGWEDSPRKEMAAHSRILAWEFPWTEELVGCRPCDRKELDTTEWITHTQTQIVSYSGLILFTYKVERCLNILYTHFRLLNNLNCDLLFCFINTWISNIYSIPLT